MGFITSWKLFAYILYSWCMKSKSNEVKIHSKTTFLQAAIKNRPHTWEKISFWISFLYLYVHLEVKLPQIFIHGFTGGYHKLPHALRHINQGLELPAMHLGRISFWSYFYFQHIFQLSAAPKAYIFKKNCFHFWADCCKPRVRTFNVLVASWKGGKCPSC